MNEEQLKHEIKWLENEIEKLKLQLVRKPSKIRHIRCLERQIKEINLQLTFGKKSV